METQDWLMLIGGIVLLLASIAAVIFSVKSGKRINKALSAGLAEVTETKVRVKELLCESTDNDKKNFVIFENETNEEIKISVSEEIFSDFKKDESGLLTLADGELLSFVIDEEN
ncbi:MAG: hypothetical protein IJW38_03630 [Clostridia bacterium]|nr:hypothetical protein [Clostridia bacterium]